MTAEDRVKSETFVGPPIKLEAVYLTNSNIKQIARWMQASATVVRTDLETGEVLVEFFRMDDHRRKNLREPGPAIVRANVGTYIIRRGAHVNEFGETLADYYYSLTEAEMQPFRLENKE